MPRAVHCNHPLLLHRAGVWAVSQEGTGSFSGQPPFRGGRVKCYLSARTLQQQEETAPAPGVWKLKALSIQPFVASSLRES